MVSEKWSSRFKDFFTLFTLDTKFTTDGVGHEMEWNLQRLDMEWRFSGAGKAAAEFQKPNFLVPGCHIVWFSLPSLSSPGHRHYFHLLLITIIFMVLCISVSVNERGKDLASRFKTMITLFWETDHFYCLLHLKREREKLKVIFVLGEGRRIFLLLARQMWETLMLGEDHLKCYYCPEVKCWRREKEWGSSRFFQLLQELDQKLIESWKRRVWRGETCKKWKGQNVPFTSLLLLFIVLFQASVPFTIFSQFAIQVIFIVLFTV